MPASAMQSASFNDAFIEMANMVTTLAVPAGVLVIVSSMGVAIATNSLLPMVTGFGAGIVLFFSSNIIDSVIGPHDISESPVTIADNTAKPITAGDVTNEENLGYENSCNSSPIGTLVKLDNGNMGDLISRDGSNIWYTNQYGELVSADLEAVECKS